MMVPLLIDLQITVSQRKFFTQLIDGRKKTSVAISSLHLKQLYIRDKFQVCVSSKENKLNN